MDYKHIKERVKIRAKEQERLFFSLIKWILLSSVTGAIIGTIASGFAKCITWVTAFRIGHPMVILGLPIGGLLIVGMYQLLREEKNAGTNLMIHSVRSGEEIPLRITPLILISTVITHFFGGSSGREGAALQFGGSVGAYIADVLKLNEDDKKILILASMSAAFSALFGTPMAAALFPMEVISIGVMYYAALVPCVFASFMAQRIAVFFSIRTIQIPYPVTDVPEFYSSASLKMLLLAVACALAGSMFCIALHYTEKIYKKYIENRYLRVATGGVAVIVLTALVGNQDYLGLGTEMIHSSFDVPLGLQVFLLKMLFTCITLCAGFKGGEIVPSLFIGATLGSAMSVLIGLPVDICAACGMVGVFCAVTNSPISSLLIAFELFGFDGMPYFCSVVAISYVLSGYYSLYSAQKIVYSKVTPKFIDRKTN
ncbi:MAG: chloride channel protein [Hespellia sp.]|nr:chloride channel protein [Hespellia sp.]